MYQKESAEYTALAGGPPLVTPICAPEARRVKMGSIRFQYHITLAESRKKKSLRAVSYC